MKREVDSKVKEILQKAIAEADTYNDPKFRPEHILLSIIDAALVCYPFDAEYS